jgi:hypothetical protein
MTHMTHVTHFPYKRPTHLVPPLITILIFPRPSYSECVMCVMRHWNFVVEPTAVL